MYMVVKQDNHLHHHTRIHHHHFSYVVLKSKSKEVLSNLIHESIAFHRVAKHLWT